MKVAVIGGGPAGLRAAEASACGGATVTLFDAKPSVGRKLLVAGRGGLNLTHGEDFSRASSPATPGRDSRTASGKTCSPLSPPPISANGRPGWRSKPSSSAPAGSIRRK
jgi:succinate dehydrogenase/fumarate reductase flavoprotein subunit